MEMFATSKAFSSNIFTLVRYSVVTPGMPETRLTSYFIFAVFNRFMALALLSNAHSFNCNSDRSGLPKAAKLSCACTCCNQQQHKTKTMQTNVIFIMIG